MPSATTTDGVNLAEELAARRNCRATLWGVRVTVEGLPGTWHVFSSRRDEDGGLSLLLNPGRGRGPGSRRITPRPGLLWGIPASSCTIVGGWPCTCCRRRATRA